MANANETSQTDAQLWADVVSDVALDLTKQILVNRVGKTKQLGIRAKCAIGTAHRPEQV